MNILSGMNWLRAIAALLVVIYHLNQHLPLGTLNALTVGIYQSIGHLSIMVSVFFMLSGFFRSLSYWKNIDIPESIPQFFPSLKDRFFRIAPAYYIMLITSLIVTYIIQGYSSINFPALFSGFFFLSWISPDTLFPVLINGPLWFISFDMIGWILTSLFMMGLCKIQKKYYSFYFIGIILLTLTLHNIWIHLPWSPSSGISSIWFPAYNPFLFFLHFLFGIFAAGIVTWLRKKEQVVNISFDVITLATTGIILIFLWSVRTQDDWGSIPDGPYHFPFITTMIAIIMICLPFTRYIGKLLDNSFFTFTAKISYSLFLIHALIVVLLLEYIFKDPLMILTWIYFSITTLIISYLFAWLMYRYIELPCIPQKITPKK